MDRKWAIYRKWAILAVSWMGMVGIGWGFAQEQAEESVPGQTVRSSSGRSPTPILDRIESAGKNLFGLLPLPGLSGPRRPPASPPRSSPWAEAPPPPVEAPETGLRNPAVNIYRTSPSGRTASGSPSGEIPLEEGAHSNQMGGMRSDSGASRPEVRPAAPGSASEAPSSDQGIATEGASGAVRGSPWGLPLHERLRVFRESGFAGAGVGRSEPTLPTPSPQTTEDQTERNPSLPSAARSTLGSGVPFRRSPEPGRGVGGGASAKQEPTLAPPRSSLSSSGPSSSVGTPSGTGQAGSGISGSSSGTFATAGSGSSSLGSGADLPGRSTGLGAKPAEPAATGSESLPRVNRPSATQQNPARQGTESDSLLMTPQSPILSIQTHGPRRITVGKEAPYEVVIQNSGSVAANDLVVTVDLPPWAEVLSAEASVGSTQAPGPTDKAGQFLWRIGRLDPRGQEKLILRIVPRESRPFELGVRWSFTPQRLQTAIEVQEPKLGLQLEGPREVVHGQRQIYKLIMTNTGNGPAENVTIFLASKGAGEQVSASHKLGTLSPGEKKVLEVELIPRSPGPLTLEVQLQGDGNAQASLTETITVRKPELRLTLTGPTEHFVGAAAVYRLQVANPGNAPAKNVQVTLQLPEGLDQIVASPEGRLSFDRRKVEWTFPEIAAGAAQELSLRCQYRVAGLARISAKAAADADLSATDSINTQVEAVADLTLSVADPPGPVPVGEEAVYEIRIHNRGTKAATQVEVVVYFSHGIEPVAAEGASNRIGPGQVVFSPIAAIGPGQTQVLKVKAKAERAGNHIFRAEVHCRSASVRLVSEGTTRYFGNAVDRRVQLAQPAPPDRSSNSPEQAPVRTAERGGSFRDPSSNAPRKN